MHRFFYVFTLSVALLSASIPASAQPGQGPWSVDDILKQASISDVNVGPDGQRLLWTKRYPNVDEDKYQRDIYLTYRRDPFDDDTSATVRLTRTGNNRNPRWSPNGQRIAFTSSRELPDEDDTKGTQIWEMDPRGGAPYPLTSLDNGVRSFAWLDNERILFSAREKDTHHEEALEKAKDDARAVEDSTLYYPVRLFTVNVETNKVERVTSNDQRITEFAPDPSGRYVVYSVDPSIVDADARHQPKQYLLDLASGETTEIFAEQYFDPGDFQWTLNGDGFYAQDTYSSDPEHEGAGIRLLYFYDLSARSYQNVPLDADSMGIGAGGYAVTSDGIHVQIADGPRMEPRFYRRRGNQWTPRPVQDERFQHSTSIEVGPDGKTVVFTYSRADRLPTYHVGTYQQGQISDVQEWVQINEYLKKRPLPNAEVIQWEGAEGDTVNGILYYPLDYDPSRSYPLITAIHGGPSGVDLDVWRLGWTVYPGLWTQRGAFVFRPNYHGSGHHGLDWVESIKKRYYELEIPDIVKGIQHLVDQGKVDPDSLGVMGWSNGAILTIQLTVEHPDLFEVAAPGAGDVNWTSDYGNCAFGVSFDNSYFGGPPWENADHYLQKSPFFQLDQVQTPTLIHHGTEDRAVPYEQGWEFYRALQQIGKTPVRFLSYPGEPHGLGEISHQRRKVEEDLKWIDTYLFGTTSMDERVAKRVIAETSPLAYLDRQQDIATSNGRYGAQQKNTLVPELVPVGDSLLVGRFEVTRAQFKAFRSNYDVSPPEANDPANGLSAEDAQAYAQWLSEQTGQPYRLPTEAELKALRKLAGSSENDLTYWAGYTPTPDERNQLTQRLLQSDPDDLLMPVGSRPPGHAKSDHAPLIYDLNGNVAEWATTENGDLRPMNGSAVTRRAPKTSETEVPPAAFIGLRVVMDQP